MSGLGLRGFSAELRRRRVYRVAVVYAIVAWLVVQVANATFPNLHLPPWTTTFVVLLALLGFPIALVLAWAFEITPEGVRRTQPLEPHEVLLAASRAPRRATTFKLAAGAGVLGALLLALNVGGWRERLLGRPGSATIGSLAVLPLENHMGDPAQEYFADGMTEALIAELARLGSLRVISRTSVMRYKEAPKSVPEIAKELKVHAVVEGSVLRAGDRGRITVQLVHAPTDRRLWTNEYERDLRDILALQREVARAIAGEIRAKLTPSEELRLTSATLSTPRPTRPISGGATT